ncbi:MAG: hypothetical protein NG747_00075 [Candidatus Brocadia sp.]|nr:hypothetical protein [Candidatus Brocadia sp.]
MNINKHKNHKIFLKALIILVNYFLFYGGAFCIAKDAIIRKGNSFVKIKEFDESFKITNGSLNHPYHFSEKELTDIFSQIFFQEKGILGSKKTKQVFSEGDMALVLSPLLVTGFAQLKPTQYLLVYNSLTRSYIKNKHNYFCLFAVGQNLHIVFSRIHQELTRPYTDEENIIINGIEFEYPMNIRKGALWKLSPVSGQSVQPDRENILIIPLSRHDSDLLVSGTDKKGAFKKPVQEKESNGESVSGFTLKGNSADNEAVNDGMNQTGETSRVLKERLRLLKNLLEEELISHENYEKKKGELLDKYFEISSTKKD